MAVNTVLIKNTSSVTLRGVKPGATVKVAIDRHGVAKDRYWRNRLRDAKIDGCVKIENAKKTSKKGAE
jgi:hypothetical protein